MNVNEVFKKHNPKEGAKWFEFKGGKFLIAPANSPMYKDAILKTLTLKQVTAMEQKGPEALDMPGAEALGKLYRIYSDAVVIDWEDIKDGEKNLKFNKEMIFNWMMQSDEFAGFIISSSAKALEVETEEQGEVEKN